MTKPLVLSATQIKLHEGCERQYWFERIAKVPVIRSSAAMQLGLDTEVFIERYLTDGTPPPPDKAGRLATAMAKHLPPPMTEGLDHQASFTWPIDGLDDAAVTGRIDLRIRDKRGWTTIVDYKTTSSIEKWALTERTLPDNIQAQLYAYNSLSGSTAPTQRMRWIYGQTKGPMDTLSVEISMTQAQAQIGYDRARRAAVRILEIREPDFKMQDTSIDRTMCNAYGGCPFRGICPATEHKTISQIFGDDMGLLDRLNATKTDIAPEAPVVDIAQPAVNPPDAAPSPEALPEKKTRAKKAAATAPSTTAPVVFTLLINAVSRDSVSLAPLIQAAAQLAAERAVVVDYRQVPFGGGAPLLLAAFKELFKPARSFYSVDTRQPETNVVLGYLESSAESVIQGV